MPRNRLLNKTGFTLTELLISLAVLGVIATFTIPKLLNVVGDGPKKAILKETIASIQAAAYQASIENGVASTADAFNYLAKHLNYVKACPNNTRAEGCRSTNIAPLPAGSSWSDEPGFLLQNGAIVTVYYTDNTHGTSINIDINGDSAPNDATVSLTNNGDFVSMTTNFTNQQILQNIHCGADTLKPGELAPFCKTTSPTGMYYQDYVWIFQD
jgi:prepilin-type N-terminal cleavage/methylation domain-containing protein